MLLVFIISLTSSLINKGFYKKNPLLINKADCIGVQKYHEYLTPRIGGAPAFIGLWLTIGLSNFLCASDFIIACIYRKKLCVEPSQASQMTSICIC